MGSTIFRGALAALIATFVLGMASASAAQTYTLTSTLSGPGGVTGTAVLVLDNATLAPSTGIGNVAANSGEGPANVPAELVSATLTLNNLGAVPATTTFNRSDLSGLYFRRNSAGAVSGLSFDAANSDGYILAAAAPLDTNLSSGAYTVRLIASGVVSGAPATPVPIPTLSEWAMILLGVALAGGAALMIQRRRVLG